MDETKKNGSDTNINKDPRVELAENISALLTKYAMGSVQIPGQPPPPVVAFATIIETAYAWAESVGMPRPVQLDIAFQVLCEREVMKQQQQQQTRLVHL